MPGLDRLKLFFLKHENRSLENKEDIHGVLRCLMDVRVYRVMFPNN